MGTGIDDGVRVVAVRPGTPLLQVDTDDVAPMTSVVAMRLAWREDRVTDGDRAEAVLANAPARQGDYFVVPRVVE